MAELREQFEVEQGDIVRPVEPVGQRRSAEPGMRRRDHATLAAQQADERVVGAEAAGAVQEQHGRAVTALPQFEIDPGQRDSAHGRPAPFRFRVQSGDRAGRGSRRGRSSALVQPRFNRFSGGFQRLQAILYDVPYDDVRNPMIFVP